MDDHASSPYGRRPYASRTSSIPGSSLYNDPAYAMKSSHQNATTLKTVLPVALFTIGAVLTVGTLMSDLIGIATLMGSDGPRKAVAIGIGLALMIVGAAMDMTVGRRHIMAWLKTVLADGTG